MIEITIHGRGGQGGVTLAKLIATAEFLRGKHVQAFGVYAAERSGAPLQAYVRVDKKEITNHNQVRTPDHLIVLDRTLIAEGITVGLKDDGWIILNTPEAPEAFAKIFPGRSVATIDATRIAVENELGTKAVPIVNTTVFGAACKVLDIPLGDLISALAEVKLTGANQTAAEEAYRSVVQTRIGGEIAKAPVPRVDGRIAGLLDDDLGERPRIKTGSWANRRPERQHLTPPCNDGCPAGNDIQRFIAAAAREDYDLALEVLLETSPLPGVCGRVCPAPCMDACNRRLYDDTVNIRELERFVADRGIHPRANKPRRDERIAVVGSGPAGLSAAYALARLGYPVSIYESASELGGVLRTGIPAYRLPRSVLDSELQYILRHGVETHCNVAINRNELVALSRQFAAVLIATGLQELRTLELGGDSATVMQGIDFLDRARSGDISVDHEEVLVVGGGNTAIDAARSARRLGAKHVRIIYRRTRAEMPAITEEIEEAIEEGVALDELVAPVQIRPDASGTMLTCQRMRLGEPDESGRRRPVPETSEGAQFDLRCDRIILALGQSPNTAILPAGAEIHDGTKLVGLTGAPVFTCGDFSKNEGTVAAAIGSGRRAALHAHQTISGENLFPPEPDPLAEPDAISMQIFERAPGQRGTVRAVAQRRQDFGEIRLGFTNRPGHRSALLEAQRCFSCGTCNNCDRCVTHCPEGIMVRNGNGYTFDESYCKGCGMCATECPRGVIYMAEL